ncbi:MAG TPA: NeuD/PglB/VioB family sugar acetyltransferase [Longimicrobiaceae bacterium]
MSAYLVWGGGGHGKVVADLIRAAGHEVAGFIDADPDRFGAVVEPGGGRVTALQEPFIATLRATRRLPEGVDAVAVAVGDNRRRLELCDLLGDLIAPALVHPHATVSPTARIGGGTVVFAGAVVNSGAEVGRGVIVNTGAIVEHDCHIGDGAHLSPGVALGGGVSIGRRSWIGLGASVIHRVSVGHDVTVGAGAAVIRDVEDSSCVVGVPARPILRSGETAIERPKRIYLSPPHMSGLETQFVSEAFRSNWVAPLGPNVDQFEAEFCDAVGVSHAVALSSGTAALHLALRLIGVGPGDEVLVSTLTFAASVNPILYLGASPIFIDSEEVSWNLDPALLAEVLEERSRNGPMPRALVLVHLYGQTANLDPIQEICRRYGVALVEDAAEALGATYRGRPAGSFGQAGIYSFNGNKIITTSGGGMLVSDDEELVEHARMLATQARDPAPHYQHSEIGYNYRMSNVLAGIGRGQIRVLPERVEARRRNFERYYEALRSVPGIGFMPEAPWGHATRWLTCITVDPKEFGRDREDVLRCLEALDVEARPVWKPMHLQPVFAGYPSVGGAVAERLFTAGLCLPSGSNLAESDIARVIDAIVRLSRVRRYRTRRRMLPRRAPEPVAPEMTPLSAS